MTEDPILTERQIALRLGLMLFAGLLIGFFAGVGLTILITEVL